MWQSYQRQDMEMRSFLAMRLPPKYPMTKIQRLKAFILGRVFKRVDNR